MAEGPETHTSTSSTINSSSQDSSNHQTQVFEFFIYPQKLILFCPYILAFTVSIPYGLCTLT